MIMYFDKNTQLSSNRTKIPAIFFGIHVKAVWLIEGFRFPLVPALKPLYVKTQWLSFGQKMSGIKIIQDKLANVRVEVTNCRYSIAQMCTQEE